MIICKSPYRITLSGGGASDFENYFTEFGPTISTGFAINKYCYTTLMHLPNINGVNYQIGYSTFERANKISEIKNAGVRGVLEYLNFYDLEKLGINIINEISPRTGIGSSSALSCALIKAIHTYINIAINKKAVAQTAIKIERYHLGENGGWNDQIFSSFGNFISIQYNKDKTFLVRPLSISSDFKDFFIKSCVLYYTSKDNTRNSFDIIKTYDNNQMIEYKHLIAEISNDIKYEIENENIEEVGKLIDKNWQYKKKLSNAISNQDIDEIYEKILKSGSSGGRLIGGGSAGFIFAVYPSPKIKEQAVKSIGIPYIDIGYDEGGTQVIFNESN